MNISISHNIERLLKRKVEDGHFPTEEAVIEEALRRFLTDEPATPHAPTWQAERLPSPFLEDEAIGAPVGLPRPDPVVSRSCVWDDIRHPDLAPGE